MLDLGKPLAGTALRQVLLLLRHCVLEVGQVVSGTLGLWQTKCIVKQLQNWVPLPSVKEARQGLERWVRIDKICGGWHPARSHTPRQASEKSHFFHPPLLLCTCHVPAPPPPQPELTRMHTGSCPECFAGFPRLLGVETTASHLGSSQHPYVLYLSYHLLHRTLVALQLLQPWEAAGPVSSLRCEP